MPATPPNAIWRANKGGQWAFLASPYWEALANGDRGGGKTATLIISFLKHVGKGFGTNWRGVIFRLTYPELGDVIDRSKTIIPASFPGANYNIAKYEWDFPAGEKLMFRHLENLKAYSGHHGHSYPFIAFDELTAWSSPEPYEAMLSCSRPVSANPGIPLMIRATTNSWGVGFSWVRQRFIQGKEPYKPYGPKGRERIRIPIRWQENRPFVSTDPDYHIRLAESISNEAQRKAWIDNSWDIMAGGRFSDVWRESVHWVEPFQIPERWYVDRSHDWGSSAPFCTLWYAESNGEQIEDGRSWPAGTIFVISEDYGCEGDFNDPNWKPNVGLGLSNTELAIRTRNHEENMLTWGLIKYKPNAGPGDDPLFDVTRGRSMNSQMSDYGISWLRPSKGPGSRVTGWQLIEDRLKASMAWPQEEPGLFMFNTCHHLRRTLPIAPRDVKKPDDIDTADDHALDCLRIKLLSYNSGASIVHGVTL